MNAVRDAVPQKNDTVARQGLAQPLNTRPCTGACPEDFREAIANRYPVGLLSDAELEALLGGTKP